MNNTDYFANFPTVTVITVERVTGPITGVVSWYVYKGDDKRFAQRFGSESDAIALAERWHFQASGEAVVITID